MSLFISQVLQRYIRIGGHNFGFQDHCWFSMQITKLLLHSLLLPLFSKIGVYSSVSYYLVSFSFIFSLNLNHIILSSILTLAKTPLSWGLKLQFKNLNSISATPSSLPYVQYKRFPFSCIYSTDILIQRVVVITEVIVVERETMPPPSNECVQINKQVILTLVYNSIPRRKEIRTPTVYLNSSISNGTSKSSLLTTTFLW